MRVCAKAVSSTNTQRERKTEKRERKKKIGREREGKVRGTYSYVLRCVRGRPWGNITTACAGH